MVSVIALAQSEAMKTAAWATGDAVDFHRLMRLHTCVADFVADEDVVGVLPTADLNEPK